MRRNAQAAALSKIEAMQTIDKISEMQRWSETERCQGRRISFVPTMGFLHEGHLSLVRHARSLGDRVVVSVFVNPTQFAPQEDYAAYPRDFERDHKLLDNEGVEILFSPAVQEMYPQGFQTRVEVSQLSTFLCGAHRQGHFQGVATVVSKLFNAVRPHVAIFGEKDYQQLQVIRSLVRDLNFDTEIVGHPIIREADGLAMSSRNAYLSAEERKAALCLFRSLNRAVSMVQTGEVTAQVITGAVKAEIARESLAQLEYVKVCDTMTLIEVDQVQDRALLALAVRIGRTRLIDNTILHTVGKNG
jgi:pantoate--beta-alanine ligase